VDPVPDCVTVKVERSYEGSYIIQTLVNSTLFESQEGKGKFRGLLNLKHLKPYLENRIDKYKSKDILVELQKASIFTMRKEQAETGLRDDEDRSFRKVRPPPKLKTDPEALRRVNNIEETATLGNVNILI
jgi:hypothetical protein